MPILVNILFFCCIVSFSARAQVTTSSQLHGSKQVLAFSLPQDAKVLLDGKLLESFWMTIPFAEEFTQLDPVEGAPAIEPTEVRFAYDENALYVGGVVKKDPTAIQAILSRRDNSASSERVIITLDTYFDRRTSFSFGVTARGVRLDYYHPDDNAFSRDYSYNPVWEARTYIDSTGWSFEMRIPFSQLRFNGSGDLTFGVNINHYVPTSNEDSFWIYVPKDEPGWASRFGLLKNINHDGTSRRLEFLPYVASSVQLDESPEPGNPYSNALDALGNIGADLKFGIGPNITVDATINPDFGQVDADPAVVNLSQFEVFLPERRPFFTEGAQLFNGGGATYFYSRRIGGSPSLFPDGDFVEATPNTTILGASKITGRNESGFSFGVLSALTSKENMESTFLNPNRTERTLVEPMANYTVARGIQEFGTGTSTIGFILTGVNRQLERNSALDRQVARHAYSGAIDWQYRFKDEMYQFSGNLGGSSVHGHQNVLLALQQTSAHYFQRPDATHLSLDSTRTSLQGFRANLSFAKRGGDHWLWGIFTDVESPGFELNDMGLLFSTDQINNGVNLTYRENQPGRWLYTYRFQIGANYETNFEGIHTSNRLYHSNSIQFHSFARLNMYLEHKFKALDPRQTRGGPLMESPSQNYINLSYNSPRTTTTFYRIQGDYWHRDDAGYGYSASTEVSGLAGERWEYSVRPSFNFVHETRQYFNTIDRSDDRTFGKRYQFATIDRSTMALQLRVNYAFTPDLSLELYAEPFASTGVYDQFGELKEARTNELLVYGKDGGMISQQGEEWIVTEGVDTFSFSNPDFLVYSLRSNLVLRYEWIPGSTLFVVWQQNRFNRLTEHRLVQPGDLFTSFGIPGNQTIALKVSYWFNAG